MGKSTHSARALGRCATGILASRHCHGRCKGIAFLLVARPASTAFVDGVTALLQPLLKLLSTKSAIITAVPGAIGPPAAVGVLTQRCAISRASRSTTAMSCWTSALLSRQTLLPPGTPTTRRKERLRIHLPS